MSELRDLYDDGAVSNRIIQPPFAELATRGRRRAYRTRTVRLAGVAMLAPLVAAPLLTVQGDGAGTDPRDFPNVQFPDEFYGSGGRSYSVEFYDASHGFATYRGDLEDGCGTTWLSATRDGGASWSELRAMPRLSPPQLPDGYAGDDLACFHPWVIPASAETLIVLVGADTRAGYEWVRPYTIALISHDAGRSWQEYEPQVETVDTVPDGQVPGQHCEDNLCEEMRLGWYDPETGDRMVLRNNPPDLIGRSGPVLAADGSISVTGVDNDGYYQVWVSEDRGRSWQDRSPDRVGDPSDPGDPADPDRGTEFATGDGETGYLWTWGPGADDALHRTDDGGETWHRLPAGHPFTAPSSMRVAPDGTLAVAESESGTQYVSSDRGETFQATDQPLWEVRPLAEGWYGFLADDSAENPTNDWLSEDGLTWQPVRIPRP